MKSIIPVFFILFSIYVSFSICGFYTVETKHKQLLLEHMYGECLAICDEHLKNQDLCPDFCDFVNHLYNHDNTIYSIFSSKYRQDNGVLQWALTDVIEWKLKTKSDDKHEASMALRDALVKWGDYKLGMKHTLGNTKEMAGRGRGMAMTKPAWMTGQATGGDTAANTLQPSTTQIPSQSNPQNTPAVKEEWVQYTTPEGKIYFYNTTTGVSSWEKPTGTWVKYTTAEGVPYYYNSITRESKWELPNENKKQEENKPIKVTETKVTQTTSNITQKKEEENNNDNNNEAIYNPQTEIENLKNIQEINKEKQEAIETFKIMMKELGVKSNYTWDMALNKIIDDPRYQVLGLLADRKNAFYELIESLKMDEMEKNHVDQEKSREAYLDLLRSCTDLTYNSSFRKFSQTVENDSRWFGLSSDMEKEYLFEEYMITLKKISREKERQEKQENRKKYREYLQSVDWINVNTQWRNVKERLSKEECFNNIDMYECLKIFEDHIRSLEAIEIENDRKRLDQIKRKSRKARQKFRGLLDNLYSQGKFGCSTPWQTVYKLVENEPEYKEMLVVEGSTPGELYGDFIELIKEDYYQKRDLFRRIQKNIEFIFSPDTSKDDYVNAFSKDNEFDTCNNEYKDIFYDEMIEYAVKKQKDKERKREIIINEYCDYLDYKFYKKISKITWKEAKEILEQRSIYKDLDDEILAEKLFLDYKNSAAEKAIVSDSSEDEHKSHKHKSHKTRKDKRSHSSRKHRKHRSGSPHDYSDEDEHYRRSKRSSRSHRSKKKRRYESISDDDKPPSKKSKYTKTQDELEAGEIIE